MFTSLDSKNPARQREMKWKFYYNKSNGNTDKKNEIKIHLSGWKPSSAESKAPKWNNAIRVT